MRCVDIDLSAIRMGPGNPSPKGKPGERVSIVVVERGALEMRLGKIVAVSTRGRLILRLDGREPFIRVPADRVAAVF